MKFLPFLALSAVSTVIGASVDGAEPEFLLEFSRGESRWVTQEEKWTLRQVGVISKQINVKPWISVC